ncbi:hypothetical protein B296_00034157, partial [Ensete ventricosum]
MAPAVVAPATTLAPCHPGRVRVLKPASPSLSGPVVYWMFRDQRSANNWALVHAAALAAQSDVPLAVAFCLSHRFLGAHARQLGFMLRGLRHLSGRLAALGLPFFLLRGDAPDTLPGFLSRLGASGLVADFSPLRPVRAWKDSLCERLPAAVAFHEVDAHNVVPVWITSDKLEYGAKTIRPKIHRLLTEYLVEFPQLPPPAVPWIGEAPPEIDWDELIDEVLREAGEVPEVGWCEPGEEAAMEALMGRKDGFLTRRLKHYDSDRNDPMKSRALSGLSPYLHFGQISAQRCALEAWKLRKSCHQIVEHQKEEQQQQEEAAAMRFSAYVHNPTPLHPSVVASSTVTTPPALTTRRPSRTRSPDDGEAVYVSCDKCRPTSRDKLISVVPLDNAAANKHPPAGSSSPGPGGLLRSLFLPVTRRSPAAAAGVASAASATSAVREDQWRLVAAELSRKLLHATRKRDEALLEASRLEYSLTELERKIDRLESHCRDLRASIQPGPALGPSTAPFPTETFHVAIADARAAVRHLARSLIAQVRLGPAGSRSSDRLTALIQHYDPWAAIQWRRNPDCLLFHMEALLNQAFYAGFEEDDEEEARLIDPAARCEASRAGSEAVRGLGWDEVLCKGTRHHSEGLSRFCDRKMSEVVGVVG